MRTDGLITWTVTNGVVFLEEPVVFSVRSCLTEARTYASATTDPLSVIIGAAYTLPDHRVFAGGYQRFDFVGPALPQLSIQDTATNVTVR
ncbi:MAG: hypothetical protein HYY24_29150 [Verrucomicrobia bacterium]|nr:hypothetical protein [Verrucomicrobiota bacterium]